METIYYILTKMFSCKKKLNILYISGFLLSVNFDSSYNFYFKQISNNEIEADWTRHRIYKKELKHILLLLLLF